MLFANDMVLVDHLALFPKWD